MTISRITLKNVRLSFPNIFETAKYNGADTGKYQATFLFPKEDVKTKETLDTAIKQIITESKLKIKPDNICLRDGDDIFSEKGYLGYEGQWALKTGNKEAPTIVDSDKTPLLANSKKIYAGCYVNAIIGFWLQDNNYGKRINANLYGIQFAKDGEPFGEGKIDVTEEFEDISDKKVDDLDDI